jgi:hypothetical protein
LPRERVWLVFDKVSGTASVRLNERLLGEIVVADRAMEFDITDELAPTNVLLVDVSSPESDPAGNPHSAPSAGGLTGEVRLEVRTVARHLSSFCP